VVHFFEEFRIEVAVHQDLSELLQYLRALGLQLPEDPLLMHEKLHVLE